MWSRKRKIESAEERRAAEYVTSEEFCSIFTRDMQPLYTLALVLTGDQEKAEQCFLGALEDCQRARVFRNWAQSWARLAIIERAIRIVKPLLARASSSEPEHRVQENPGLHPEALPILRLNAFDRFVFALLVLDRYSVRDCAILLKCARREVEEARRRAVEFFAEAGRQLLPAGTPGLMNPVQI